MKHSMRALCVNIAATALLIAPPVALGAWTVVESELFGVGTTGDTDHEVDGSLLLGDGYIDSYVWSGNGWVSYFFRPHSGSDSFFSDSYYNVDWVEFAFSATESVTREVRGSAYLIDSYAEVEGTSSL